MNANQPRVPLMDMNPTKKPSPNHLARALGLVNLILLAVIVFMLFELHKSRSNERFLDSELNQKYKTQIKQNHEN